MMRMTGLFLFRTAVAVGASIMLSAGSVEAGGDCQIYDVTDDWSDASNPNGAWSYREGPTPLPHVEAWQRTIGGWSEFQPGWAESEDANNRLPFWFKSNGTETFEHDYVAGDVVTHTWDGTNGSGNGQSELVWTSPFDGMVSIAGSVWMGRDIGRSVTWSLLHGETTLSQGSISSGDTYSRSDPFDFAFGWGGSEALMDIAVEEGDEIHLVLTTTSQAGDFVGVRMTVTCETVNSTSTTSTTTTVPPTTTTLVTTTTTLPTGNCGDPLLVFQPGDAAGAGAGNEGGIATINASDALYVLRAAVGSVGCTLCECDVNNSGSITATDSLAVLRNAVGQNVELTCPPCDS